MNPTSEDVDMMDVETVPQPDADRESVIDSHYVAQRVLELSQGKKFFDSADFYTKKHKKLDAPQQEQSPLPPLLRRPDLQHLRNNRKFTDVTHNQPH